MNGAAFASGSYDAILFDVDGTLAETEEAHRLAFNAAFREAGLAWHWDEAQYRALLKVTGGKERIAAFMQAENLAMDAALIARLHASKTSVYTRIVAEGSVPLRPGIEKLITAARAAGLTLGIATTTSRANIDALISATLGPEALGWFSVIASAETAPLKKPAPDVYLAALETLGLDPARVIAIEDSFNGIRAAREAGLRVIATPSFYCSGDDLSEATRVMEAGESLVALLGL